MSRNNRIFALIVGGLVILVCLALPVMGFVGFNVVEKVTPGPTVLLTALPQVLPLSKPSAAPVCNGPASMSILLIGSDSRQDNYYAGLSDSMRVVRVDFVKPSVMYLAFQRDLYVEIPGISDHGNITHGKLNQAFLYGNPGFGYYDGPGQGPGLLGITLKKNFGAHVDHYVAVNTATFLRVVDALGGIDVYLPHAVDGRSKGSSENQLFFPAGPQHLDGARATILARLRPDGDLERSDVQNILLQALAARILTPTSLPQMPKVVEAFYGSVQTDLTADDIAKLLCVGSMISPDKVRAVDFPANLFTQGRVQDPVLGYTFVWDVDFKMLRAYVDYFNRGAWPETPLAAP